MSGVGDVRPSRDSMSERALVWLKSNPTLAEVKKALGAVVAKAEAAEGDQSESRKTADILTEYYVELGGDLDELPTFMDDLQLAFTAQSLVPQLDLSPLCPDGPITPSLTAEEKLRVFQDLQRKLGRAGVRR